MRFVIVTGMSGAGKSTALKMLEDVGYFCVDNLPIPVIPALASLLSGANSEIDKLALGIDIRDERNFTELEEVLKKIDDTGFAYEVLFLEAGDDVLIKRYQETRRTHPIAGNERLDKGIELEREKLKFLKSKATYIVDTSKMLTRELKGELNKIFVENKEFKNLPSILSNTRYGYAAEVIACNEYAKKKNLLSCEAKLKLNNGDIKNFKLYFGGRYYKKP